MASPESLKILRELQSRPDNKICCDCNSKNPQWASVSYGCFMYVAVPLPPNHESVFCLLYAFPSASVDACDGVARVHGRSCLVVAIRGIHAHPLSR